MLFPDGKNIDVEIRTTDTGDDFKARISETTGKPACALKLIFNGGLVDGSDVLANKKMVTNCAVHCHV